MDVLAALLSGQLKPEACSADEWENLLSLAAEHKVIAPIYRLYRAAYPNTPDPDYERFRFAQSAYLLQLQLITSEIQRVFAAHTLPVIWLKGVILAHTVYDEPWLRYMRDLDFLVPYERRREALDLLKGLGFIHTRNGLGREFEKFHSDYQLSYQNDDHLIVAELHYKPLSYVAQPPYVDTQSWFWSRTQTISTPAGDLTAFTDEAMFLHLVLHDVFHHERRFPDLPTAFEPPQLRRKYDIFLMFTRRTLNFDVVFEGAKTLDCLYALVCELEDLQQLFGLDFTAEIARCKADSQYPVRFNFRQRDAQIKLALLSGTLRDHSPREIIGFIQRIFVGSPESLRTNLNLSEETRVYPHHYVIRTLRRMVNFFAALPPLLIGWLNTKRHLP